MRSARTLPAFAVLVSLASLASAFSLSACAEPPIEPRYAASAGGGGSITVTSRAFTDGSRLPVDNTCDGGDVMPELVLSSPPDNTKSLLVIVDDPDATGASGLFTHMIAFNLSPELRTLPSAPDLTAGGEAARFGLNDFGSARYQGPCPPKGEAHRYRFRVIALDTMLKLPEGAQRAQVDKAIDGHILGEGTLFAHFGH